MSNPLKAFGRPRSARIVWLSLPVATAIVGYAFYNARRSGDLLHFHIFWIGILTFMVPVIVCLVSAETPREERLRVTAAFGLFAYLAKFLRDPTGPLWYDELAHWRQVETIHAHQTLFQSNPLIRIVKDYPGLHGATDALRELTGASTFAAGSVLIAVLHLAALVGVFFIAERLWDSARIGGVAAIIYACNPGFSIFDTQFAYESLGFVFFIWAVAAMVGIQTAVRPRRGWLAAGTLIVSALAITHHVSSYVAAGVLVIAAGAAIANNRTEKQAIQSALLAAAAVATTAAWLGTVASSTFGYLSPHLGGGISQTFNLLAHPTGGRTLFRGSLLPPYERVAAFLTPPLALFGVAAGIARLRGRGAMKPMSVALTALGLTYFAALPFFLSKAGSEGARRSLDFSYLGVAVLVVPGAMALADRARKHSFKSTVAATGAVVTAIVIVLMGNVASGFNGAYRFPGPYIYGSDVRDQTPELRAAVDWFRATQGTERRMVVDRYNGMVFASRGLEHTLAPSTGFPAWDLYFDTSPPPSGLIDNLSAAHDDYLVIDERMAQHIPLIGFYFEPSEPLALARRQPIPAGSLYRYAFLPWTRNIYSSNTLRIYRFDFEASLSTREAVSDPRPGP